MSKILGLISPLGLGGDGASRADDDFIDRMNHSYTVIVLVVFAIIVSTKQYVGDPIQCWVPAHFTSNYEDYANKICWVANTYYNPFDKKVPGPDDEGEPKKYIVYYQWVPLILLTQALCFYLPYTIWTLLNTRSGMDVNSLVDAAKTMHDSENHEKTLRYIIKQLDRYCTSFRPNAKGRCLGCKKFITDRCFFGCGRKHGTYLLVLYMFVKFCYVINAIIQFFLLDAFIGNKYHLYGIKVIKSLINQEDWMESERFPRVTLCDFFVRQLGNIHKYTVQCVLPINLFNEKIYIFIWFWFVLLAMISLINLAIWLGRTLFRVDHIRFIKRYLRSLDKIETGGDKKILRRFVLDYLRPDGVLVIRLLSLNTNELAVAEIVAELWEYFKTNPPSWHRVDDDVDDV